MDGKEQGRSWFAFLGPSEGERESLLVGDGVANTDPYKVDTPKPRVVDDTDVVLKVTGSTVCGSDLHLLHGKS